MRSSFALVNARVWTMETDDSRFDALLVEAGRIEAVGEERAILGKARRRGAPALDAKGHLVLPGLIDSHTHLIHEGLLADRVDLSGSPNLRAALARVGRALRGRRDEAPLIAERWDESAWPEKRFPRRDELDALSRTTPIILRRVDGHVAVANKTAARMVSARLPGVDVDAGLLLEDAALRLNEVFPTPAPQASRALQAAQAKALALGVTTVHDFVVPSYLRAYQLLHRAGRLRIRAHVSPYMQFVDGLERVGILGGFGDDRLRLEGMKVFADGSIGGHTAAFHEPYEDRPEERGRLNWQPEELRTFVERADAQGLRSSLHAIGDAAIDAALDALGPAARGRRLPPRIEHFECPSPEAVERAASLGVIASMQPNFVGTWSGRNGMYERRVGRRRARRSNRFREFERRGLRIAFGSDCMPFNPWVGLQSCLDAPEAAQRLPLATALRHYTSDAADALGRPDLGRLRPGARADLVIVDLDPKRPKAAQRARVVATYVEGHALHSRVRLPARPLKAM